MKDRQVSWTQCDEIYDAAAAAAAKSLQSCLTLCNPIDSSPPGCPVPRILQARMLEWVAISFSNAWKWKVKVKSVSRVQLLATPWTAAYQAPPSIGFSRQEYWSGVPLSSPEIYARDMKRVSGTHSTDNMEMTKPKGRNVLFAQLFPADLKTASGDFHIHF